MEKESYQAPKITRIDLEDTEVVGMAICAKSEMPLINNPCAVGGIGGPGGTPITCFGS